ncbi:hypothetical protein BC943DRAFT_366366 [Umbelopsis sp. AD052]|nr:hypothetical protein BC943DRAFT_366366 [Umbelopsis sp. AD052]
MSSESSENDEDFYNQRQNKTKTKKKIHRERIAPDNVTKNIERYVPDLNQFESSDDEYNMGYEEHTLTSHPSQSQIMDYVGATVRNKKDDRNLNNKNWAPTPKEGYYNSKRWKDEVNIRDDDLENDFRDLSIQMHPYPVKRYKEPDREQARHRTTHIERSGKITRMLKVKKDLGEYEQPEELNQYIEPQRERISNGARMEDHNHLKLTKYDMIALKQAEETHRMFMEVWLPSRASSRSYSKLKRSIWDTPAHLLVLKQTHAQNIQ